MSRTNLLVLVALIATVALLGAASLGAVGATTELHNETHTIGNDTSGVYLDVTNTTDQNGTAQNVTATFTGIDSNGNETQLDSVVLSAGANETVSHEIDVNPDTYDKVRVTVDGEQAETIDSGLIGRVGGGGFDLNGSAFGLPIWLWLLAAAGAFIYSRSD
jgi:Tfp pilus assembly protein FimT